MPGRFPPEPSAVVLPVPLEVKNVALRSQAVWNAFLIAGVTLSVFLKIYYGKPGQIFDILPRVFVVLFGLMSFWGLRSSIWQYQLDGFNMRLLRSNVYWNWGTLHRAWKK